MTEISVISREISREISAISIEDGMILGLGFAYDDKLRIIKILGAESLQLENTYVVRGFAASDMMIALPSPVRLTEAEIAVEREIHSLDGPEWRSSQTGPVLLHQFRPELRYNMVSPLEALAALQRQLGKGLTYHTTNREVFLNSDSIQILPDSMSGGALATLACGPHAPQYVREHGTSRVLAFRDMPVEIASSVRSELSGLGHLFALTVGAAFYLTVGAELSLTDITASPSPRTT